MSMDGSNTEKEFIPVSPQEWEIANAFFKEQESKENKAIKLDKKSNPDVLQHSFVKVEGVIYAINPGKDLILGEGAYGKVKMVQTQAGDTYAIKVEGRQTGEKSAEDLEAEDIMREIGYLKGTDTRVSEKDYFLGKTITHKQYTVSDLRKGQELFGALMDNPNLSEIQRLNIATQACQRIQELHDRGIVHKDVKPKNFMKDGDTIEAIDFDKAQRIPKGQEFVTGEIFGSADYMAPEIRRANIFVPHKEEYFTEEGDVEIREVKFTDEEVEKIYDNKKAGCTEPHEIAMYEKLKENYHQYAEHVKATSTDQNRNPQYSYSSDVYALGVMLKYDLRLNAPICDKMLEPIPENRATLSEVLQSLRQAIPTDSQNYQEKLTEAQAKLEQAKPDTGVPNTFTLMNEVSQEQKPVGVLFQYQKSDQSPPPGKGVPSAPSQPEEEQANKNKDNKPN